MQGRRRSRLFRLLAHGREEASSALSSVSFGRMLRRWNRSTADTGSMLLDEDGPARSMLSSEEELQWSIQHREENVRNGANMLLLTTAIYEVVILGLPEILMVFSPPPRSSQLRIPFQNETVWLVLFYLFKCAYPVVIMMLLYACINKSRTDLYLPAVMTPFIYLVVKYIPPTQEEYEAGECCGLQDRSLLAALMCWILLTPQVMPSMKLMQITWIYIWGIYFGTSVLCGMHNENSATNNDWFFTVLSHTLPHTLLLSVVNGIALNKKYYVEKGQRSKFILDLKHKESTKRMFNILEYMVPVHLIAPMLKNPGKVIAEQVNCASILFIMFVDFDQTASRLAPHELLDFLNHHFTLFDGICQRHGVTKIETVGEEYVCSVGVVPADVERNDQQGHQEILCRLIKVADDILTLSEQNDEVVLKMGIHTGPVVAGVIGHKLPRFRLFGDTINTAARFMQKGLPGELQFSAETYRCLPQGVDVVHRGRIEMKGKGLVTAYLLRRQKPDPSAAAPAALQASSRSRESAGRHSASRTSQASVRSSRGSIMDHLISQLPSQASNAPEARSFGVEPNSAREVKRLSSTPDPWRGELRSSLRQADGTPSKGTEVELVCLSRAGDTARSSEASMKAVASRRSPLLKPVKSTSSGQLEFECDWTHSRTRTDDTNPRVTVFEHTVQQVCSTTLGEDNEPSSGRQAPWLERALKWLLSLGPGWDTFPKDMEEAFMDWYHKSAVVKKLDRRLETHLLIGSVLTTAEILYAVLRANALQRDASHMLRLPLFLACRLAVCLIVAAWRAAFDEIDWIQTASRDVHLRLVASYGLIAALMFVSYDALRPIDEVFALAFIPVFMIVTTLHPILFVLSSVFVVEAMLLLCFGTLFFPHMKLERTIIGVGAINSMLAHTFEKNLRARYKANASISLAQDRIEHILNTLMPAQVVEEIRESQSNGPLCAHPYRRATVAQSDLCGFTKLASTRRPEEVVEFIGELFGRFDELTDEYEIYKVETVGDAYIAGQADQPLTYKNSPMSVVFFGLDMIRVTHEWSRKRGENVSCRVGVHTGECVGGIVGSEMQRYHLFGKLMTGLEVLESTAPEGRVQVSRVCKEAVEKEFSEQGRKVTMFEPRKEEFLTTSKGEVHEFSEIGGRTFVVKSYTQIRGQLKV